MTTEETWLIETWFYVKISVELNENAVVMQKHFKFWTQGSRVNLLINAKINKNEICSFKSNSTNNSILFLQH